MERLINRTAISAWNAMRNSRRGATEKTLDGIQEEGCVERGGLHRHPRNNRLKVCETPSYVVTFDCDHAKNILRVMFLYRKGSSAANQLLNEIKLTPA
jgi:hypothetical protein